MVVPADVAWSEGGISSAIHSPPKAPIPASETVERAATLLRSGLPTRYPAGWEPRFTEGD